MGTTEVAWLGALEASAAVAAGEIDPVALVAAVRERAARLNPELRAYVHLDLEARASAGPLAGVTLAVKDTYPVAGMPWTAGSRRWRDRVPGQDAAPVAEARARGATLLGKTNTPELAASVGCQNELFGATHNPWRRGLTPGGSSGGSGAAVAAGLCAVAFGDDMGGSIRIPAACCGVAGLRPSPGRVPDEYPDPTGLSVRGPLARSVADLELAFAVMSQKTAPERASPQRRLRIGVVERSRLPVAAGCQEAGRRAARALADAGHRLETVAWEPEPVLAAYQVVRPVSLAGYPGEPEEYGEAVRGLIGRGRAIPTRELMRAHQAGLAAAAALRRRLEGLDAVLTPTLGRLPMPIAEVPAFLSEDWAAYVQFMLPVSFAGLPAVALPAGDHEGLPVGVQLIGRPWGEWALLELASELEAAAGFGFVRPPEPSPPPRPPPRGGRESGRSAP